MAKFNLDDFTGAESDASAIKQLHEHGVEGDENATVNTFAKIEEGKEGAISFLSNPKYTHYIFPLFKHTKTHFSNKINS